MEVKKEEMAYIKKYLPSNRLEEGIELLKKGVSPQYIVGNVDFYGNIIEVDNRVLIPRFETELLVEITIHKIKELFQGDIKILDIGTGSGCIAITLAKELECQVVGVDISNDALEVAKKNASNHHVEVEFVVSDVFCNVVDSFDVIVSNPPYIRYDEEIEEIVKRNEPSIALYAAKDGLYYYDKILKECRDYLNDKFLIAFEIGYLQGESIKRLAYVYLGDVKVEILKDYSARDRFVLIYKSYFE